MFTKQVILFAIYSGLYAAVNGLIGVVTQVMSEGKDITEISYIALLFCFLLGFGKFLFERMKDLKPANKELDV